jgi:hypothetical protein
LDGIENQIFKITNYFFDLVTIVCIF